MRKRATTAVARRGRDGRGRFYRQSAPERHRDDDGDDDGDKSSDDSESDSSHEQTNDDDAMVSEENDDDGHEDDDDDGASSSSSSRVRKTTKTSSSSSSSIKRGGPRTRARRGGASTRGLPTRVAPKRGLKQNTLDLMDDHVEEDDDDSDMGTERAKLTDADKSVEYILNPASREPPLVVERIIFRCSTLGSVSTHAVLAPELSNMAHMLNAVADSSVASATSTSSGGSSSKATPTSTSSASSSSLASSSDGDYLYYVKWKFRSYRRCTWESREHLRTIALIKLRNFEKQLESRELPDTDDLIRELEQFQTPERLLSIRETSSGAVSAYLIKWEELPYDQATWEPASSISLAQSMIAQYRQINDADAMRREIERVKVASAKEKPTDIEQPEYLVGGNLRSYQLVGFNWLRKAWFKKTNVILADQPGLGKTVQTISFIAWLHANITRGPFLIVVPLSTLNNWGRELQRWAPHLNVVKYTGPSTARRVIRELEFGMHERSGKPSKSLFKVTVLLSTYEMMLKDESHLVNIPWQVMVVDEAHMLKNGQSKRFQTLSSFRSKFRLFLTGTPLQNNLQELFFLLNMLHPEKFSSLDSFEGKFQSMDQKDQLSQLHAMLQPHILRRAKNEVEAAIPPKMEFILRVELSPLQKTYYKAILTRNFDVLTKGAHMSLMNVMTELQKCCNHPYLFHNTEPTIDNPQQALKLMLEASGKLELLDKMLLKLHENGHRVLIFSQMKRVLDILEDYLYYREWEYERLDGSVTGNLRQQRIDNFNAPNSNQFCFLLSTRAGGQGINLATADTVIIYDSDWNPHNDIQAFSRAHRIGQERKVMVYRLVTRGTLEEQLIQRSKQKLMLEHLVVEKMSNSSDGNRLRKQEINAILQFGSKELFTEDESSQNRICYDDAAITALLDRSSSSIEDKIRREGEYLNSFQVAEYSVDDAQSRSNDQFWERLLRNPYEEMIQSNNSKNESGNSFGKGKRWRRQVNYIDNSEDEDDLAALSHIDGLDPEAVAAVTAAVRGGTRDATVGFSQNQRSAFLNLLFCHGLDVDNWASFAQRTSHLRKKSLEQLIDYGTVVLRHLMDPSEPAPLGWDDLPVRDLLQRIWALYLIRRKVQQTENEPADKFTIDERNWTDMRDAYASVQFPWRPEHDKAILIGVRKYGYSRWAPIIRDRDLDLYYHVMGMFDKSASASAAASGASTTSSSSSTPATATTSTDTAAASSTETTTTETGTEAETTSTSNSSNVASEAPADGDQALSPTSASERGASSPPAAQTWSSVSADGVPAKPTLPPLASTDPPSKVDLSWEKSAARFMRRRLRVLESALYIEYQLSNGDRLAADFTAELRKHRPMSDSAAAAAAATASSSSSSSTDSQPLSGMGAIISIPEALEGTPAHVAFIRAYHNMQEFAERLDFNQPKQLIKHDLDHLDSLTQEVERLLAQVKFQS